ncbi:hypothetical protein, partial [Streptomyces bambusae]
MTAWLYFAGAGLAALAPLPAAQGDPAGPEVRAEAQDVERPEAPHAVRADREPAAGAGAGA